MGEIIKKCGIVNFRGNQFEIELNNPISDDTGGIVHVQNKDVRIEMTQADFCSMVGSFRLAKDELCFYKKIDINKYKK